jgi:hypothetical protein
MSTTDRKAMRPPDNGTDVIGIKNTKAETIAMSTKILKIISNFESFDFL